MIYPWRMIPQIGLNMTADGKPDERYEHSGGEYDKKY